MERSVLGMSRYALFSELEVAGVPGGMVLYDGAEYIPFGINMFGSKVSVTIFSVMFSEVFLI